MSTTIAGIAIPDSALAREITELVRDTETDLLFHHSRRVFLFGALTGKARDIVFDPELLYAGAMFHDMGLMPAYSSTNGRFEVDGANVARDFLRARGIDETQVDTVWAAIALHTTPGIPEHMKPEIALVTAGVEMDVLGLGFETVAAADRETVAQVHPRGGAFKEGIIDAFYEGVRHKPQTTFGNVKADVMAYKQPGFQRTDFTACILHNHWPT
ncbi:MAG: HD domain-containing protein [Luteibacter sp.]